MFNNIITRNRIPIESKEPLLLTILKKRGRHEPENYERITRINTNIKIND